MTPSLPRRLRFPLLMAIGVLSTAAAEQPNILWLTSEDSNVDWIGCYGNPHADTPNIDRLAKEGFQYMNCFANAPVCAPSRSGWITGILAISDGTFPMRSRNPIPHDRIRYYPDLLRENGYYVGNDKKTDFNIGGRSDSDCWTHHGKIDWNALKTNQPFFQIINHGAHESSAFGDVQNTDHDPAKIRLRAYHPDIPDIRMNYAKYHDAVRKMDRAIGATLEKLRAMDLSEDTIVIYNSDHGGVMPRSKRFLFRTGIHCPLIVRIPERYQSLYPAATPGTKIDRLVSFIDMPKTWLSLTGSPVPDTMQGTIFLGNDTEPEREFHFAFRARMDERVENARAVCDKRYLYIRNYMPYVPWMQHLNYLWNMKATQAWEQHVRSGQATEVQARYFEPKRFPEELYDMQTDPDTVTNLIDDPDYAEVAGRMRKELRAQQLKYYDSGLLPESEMVKRAEADDQTIYEMVRNPGLYDLPALLDAADLALEQRPDDLPELERMLDSPDAGIRYWGMVGCFLLKHGDVAVEAMTDDSHEVRAMAAWLGIQTGNREKGMACLKALMEADSYALLTVLNIIDWMGPDGKELLPLVTQLRLDNNQYAERIADYLATKQY